MQAVSADGSTSSTVSTPFSYVVSPAVGTHVDVPSVTRPIMRPPSSQAASTSISVLWPEELDDAGGRRCSAGTGGRGAGGQQAGGEQRDAGSEDE